LARSASGSSIVLPVALVGFLFLLVLGSLLLFINPGRAGPQPVDRRVYWYTGLTKSDKRWLAWAARTIGRVHRLARTGWQRMTATTTWLLGR
jgi:hypothetical protein